MTALIHPTAAIHPAAEIHPTVRVGPYATIGKEVAIGAYSSVGAHAIIEGPTEIGSYNQIFPGAAIGLEPQDMKYRGEASWVKIGDRNRIREYVTINRATGEGEATQIHNDTLLMAYVHVAHNCTISDNAILSNSVSLAGHVYIEPMAVVSGMLGIHQFVHIGRLAMVGGMSRINRDVPPFTIVEGNPARVRALNLVGLRRRGVSEAEIGHLKEGFRLLYRSQYRFSEAMERLGSSDSPLLQHLYRFMLASTEEAGRRGLTPSSDRPTLKDEREPGQ